MTEYKRYTKRDDAGVAVPNCRVCELYGECGFTYRSCYERLKDRLAELEDKIENGELTEVKHGKWISFSRPQQPWVSACSVCGAASNTRTRYCPDCGAKMDLEEVE